MIGYVVFLSQPVVYECSGGIARTNIMAKDIGRAFSELPCRKMGKAHYSHPYNVILSSWRGAL